MLNHFQKGKARLKRTLDEGVMNGQSWSTVANRRIRLNLVEFEWTYSADQSKSTEGSRNRLHRGTDCFQGTRDEFD